MNTNRNYVMVLPKLGADDLVRGYTKAEATALHGKVYAAKGAEHETGPRIGRIVGSYAYRYEGENKVHYGLNTEAKFADSWSLCVGHRTRYDFKISQSVVLLTGNLVGRVSKLLESDERPSKQLLKEAQTVVTAAEAKSLDRDDIEVIPRRPGVVASPGYSKGESEHLIGRVFIASDWNGERVGRVLGTFAYRYEDGPVIYGLNAEYKHVEGMEAWPIWKGNFFRRDLENSNSTLIPKGKVTEQAEKYLKNKQALSTELLEGLHVEVHAAQSMRKSNSQGRSF